MGTGASVLQAEVKPEHDTQAVKALASRHYGNDEVREYEAKYEDWTKQRPEGDRDIHKFLSEALHFEDDSERKFYTEEEALAAAAALGSVVKRKAKKDEVLERHKALVFDCGTGETKAIFLEYGPNGANNARCVKLKELSKAPATLDFLKRNQAANNEDYKTALKKLAAEPDVAKKAAGIAKLNDGYWFLTAKPEGATGLLEPHHFVEFCVQTKKKLADAGNLPDTVMIGCSAWARDTGKLKQEADKLLIDLANAGLLCKKLLQTAEGTFEAAAVAYAYAGISNGGTPSGLIGSGGGSVQFMHSMLYPVNMDCGYRMCEEKLMETYDAKDPVKSLETCFLLAKEYARRTNASVTGFEGRVMGEMAEAQSRQATPAAKTAVARKLEGKVVAISACYYGAESVNIGNKPNEVNTVKCEEVVARMRAKIEEDKNELLAGAHTNDGQRKTLFKEIANLTLQKKLFSELIHKDADICFKRDWSVYGVDFRTTWTAGWYLNFLYSVGVRFSGSDMVLAKYAETQATAAELLKDVGDGLGGRGGEDVAMVLVDLKTVISGMRAVAFQVANPIDKFLQGISNRFKGKMRGWPDFKVKGNKSLYRKLVATIHELLEKNMSVPEYTPDIEECAHSIHDCLRYTLTFPPEQYAEAVKAIEAELLTGDGHPAKAIKFKNFWREEDFETTYQGINAQVELTEVQDLAIGEKPVDPSPPRGVGSDDECVVPACTGAAIPTTNGFIFELQLHTEQSFEMKDGPGHLLYEDFRDPNRKKGTVAGVAFDGTHSKEELAQYKERLYLVNKELYRTKKPDGTPLKTGEVVYKGLKDTANHKWTEEDYTFKPFKPTTSMAFYSSEVTGANWRNELQVNKKLEGMLTGLDFPFGYRVHAKAEDYAAYTKSLVAARERGGSDGGGSKSAK
jgi:hypothetical protein